MLCRIDRVQMVVPDRAAAAAGWEAILGAEHHGDDRVACLSARRSRYRLGDGWIELLEPDGVGPVADAMAARGGHLFAAGASTRDLEGLVVRLRERGAEPALENGQAHLDPSATGGHGLRLVLSPEEPLPPVGAIDGLYEVTHLVRDAAAAVERCVELFGLDPGAFVPIESKHYGYAGTLTLFDPDRLHRFEVITPNDPARTMGRFFARSGETFYMAFAETGQLGDIEQRAGERRAACTPVRVDGELQTLFLHPPVLGGMMLGLSRRNHAWTWSGSPERAQSPSTVPA
ncbi:MAG: VOC family protein [Proteobacteria bacterium]|nr:VOC family protein [Pseudomonadota bacterium]